MPVKNELIAPVQQELQDYEIALAIVIPIITVAGVIILAVFIVSR